MNKFKIGNIVLYDNKKYRVVNVYDSCIQLHNINPSYHHGVTIPQNDKDYKELKLYLPAILKKL